MALEASGLRLSFLSEPIQVLRYFCLVISFCFSLQIIRINMLWNIARDFECLYILMLFRDLHILENVKMLNKYVLILRIVVLLLSTCISALQIK